MDNPVPNVNSVIGAMYVLSSVHRLVVSFFVCSTGIQQVRQDASKLNSETLVNSRQWTNGTLSSGS